MPLSQGQANRIGLTLWVVTLVIAGVAHLGLSVFEVAVVLAVGVVVAWPRIEQRTINENLRSIGRSIGDALRRGGKR